MNLQQLQQQRQEEVSKTIPCIDPTCDGNGVAICGSSGNPEPMQCEYCYRERFPIMEQHAASVLAGYLLALEEVERNISDTQQEHNIARHGDTPDDGYDRAIDVVATLKAQVEALAGKE